MSSKIVIVALAVSALVYLSIRLGVEPPRLATKPEFAPGLAASVPEGAVARAPFDLLTRERRVGATVGAPTSESFAATPSRDGLWLVGNLLGLGSLDPIQTKIRVEARGRSLSGHGLPDGTYAIDVSPLRPESLDSAQLKIQATHPAWRLVHQEARVDDEIRDQIARGYTELSVDLDLSPRTSVVGRVMEGEPEAALVRDGVVAASDEGADESGGTFALYPVEAGTYQLLVRVSDRLPLRLTVQVAVGEILDVGALVLSDEGATIEGRFMRAELLRSGVVLTATRADLVEEGEEDSWRGTGLRTGRVRDSTTEVRSDGAFHFTGLEPGAYILSLADQLSSDRIQLAYAERTVFAPASGIEFGRELGLVRLRVRGAEGDPPPELFFNYAPDPEQKISQSFGHLPITDSHPIEALVDRRNEFSAAVCTELDLASWRLIPAGRAALHEEVFELRPEPGTRFGALELAWHLPDGLLLSRTVRAYWQTDDSSANVDAEARAGGCRFERLQPGRYRIIVVPRSAQFWEPLPSFAGTRAIEVEIEAGRTTHAEVQWCLGGRARFVPEGKPLGVSEALNGEVRDALGVRCVATFVRCESGPDGIRNSSALLSLLWPSELEPNLAPGAYTLALSGGTRESVVVPFNIVEGEIVEVPIVLPE